jgi:prophage regulatory protein
MIDSTSVSPRFLEIPEVSNRVSLGRTTILLWESEGRFPRAVRLSPTKRVWLESDINAWMLEKHAQETTQ